MNAFKTNIKRQEIISDYNVFLKKWNVPFTERDISGDYGITHCIEVGDKKYHPLFLFHGVGDNSAVMWIKNIKELSNFFYCIAVDTLGGPGKSVHNSKYEKEFDQVKWITSLIDSYNYEKVNLVGVSNGGYMIYNYLLKMPQRINKIIGIEGGLITQPLKSMIGTIGLLFPEILVPTKENMKKILSKMSSPNNDFFDKNSDITDYVIRLMSSHNQKCMFKHKVNKYIRNEANEYKDRILFLFGDFQEEKRTKMFSILKEDDIKYKIISNAGHGLNMEQSNEVNKEIITFLNLV